MKLETKERAAFLAASLIELADMTESELEEVVEVVGVDAIRELMGMDFLCRELSCESMAEEICNFVGWDPMLVIPWRTEKDLSKIGIRIAGLVEDNSPGEDAAEDLVAVLCWSGIWAWLAANNEEEPI